MRAFAGLFRKARGPAILMYHRIASVAHDPWDLAVEPAVFEHQIAALARTRRPMALAAFVAALRQGSLPSNAVAVTFDDGYRDNLIHARPVLAKHSVPATLFLATANLDRNLPFWWDELADMVLGATVASETSILWEGELVTLDWGAAEPSELQDGWRASGPPATARQIAFLSVWRRLRAAAPTERERVMTQLRALFPVERDRLAETMTESEVRALTLGGVFTLGAHTVTHPALTTLNEAARRQELEDSLRVCRSLVADVVCGFAYPYGDLNGEVRRSVSQAGFEWACSTQFGHVDRRGFDLLNLPRVAMTAQAGLP